MDRMTRIEDFGMTADYMQEFVSRRGVETRTPVFIDGDDFNMVERGKAEMSFFEYPDEAVKRGDFRGHAQIPERE